jgi:hypothetical protein
MSNVSKYVIFKPVAGGYVYRVPNRWVFNSGSGQHLFVDDDQKARITRTIDTVPVLPIIVVSSVALSVLLVTAALWAGQSLSHRDALVWMSVLLALYGALFISRAVLLSRLRPILAGLPTTNERITTADIRSITARSTNPPVVLSPTRLKILRACFILMPFILVTLFISRAVDMHQETHQPMLQALYLANANFGGLTIVLALGLFLYFGLLFIRRQ